MKLAIRPPSECRWVLLSPLLELPSSRDLLGSSFLSLPMLIFLMLPQTRPYFPAAELKGFRTMLTSSLMVGSHLPFSECILNMPSKFKCSQLKAARPYCPESWSLFSLRSALAAAPCGSGFRRAELSATQCAPLPTLHRTQALPSPLVFSDFLMARPSQFSLSCSPVLHLGSRSIMAIKT